MDKAPLYGLLLVGGKSSRMGEDKAGLIYHDDTPEWTRLKKLLDECCEKILLCHREDQDFGEAAIIDPAEGPLAAIHTAQQKYPEVAWLVIACDMPLLDKSTLKFLVEKRNAAEQATAFLSEVDALPEPLCAIYEPSINQAVAEALANEQFCPRGVLKEAEAIRLPNPFALKNANTKAELLEVQAIIKNTRMKKTVYLQYFAQHKDLAEKDQETVETESVTASGLYEELKAKYSFSHKQKHLMLAINDEFAEWETPLQEGDNVVFIPPVAGG